MRIPKSESEMRVLKPSCLCARYVPCRRLPGAGVLALVLLTGAGRALADTVFQDDFNGSLNPAWGIMRQNTNYYGIQSTGLVLRCNNGDIWTSRTDARNLFLIRNPAAGDFTATVKLRWLVPPALSEAQFDLLAYDDDNNYVRLAHGMLSGVLRIDIAGEVGGVYSGHGLSAVDFGTAWFWLQMRMRSSVYSAWSSTNGVTFSPASSPFAYGDGTPMSLGFVAMVDPNQAATVVIDWFTVEDTAVPASDYTLDWWTVEGGGDTLNHEQFALAGTIGQPEASGLMAVGQYSLSGGFWSMLATAPPMPPFITSALAATGCVNRPFTYTITATGNPTGYGADGLPAGLSVNPASGLISGASAAAGVFAVSLSATNSTGVGSANLALTITRNTNSLFYDDFNAKELNPAWSIVRPNASYYSLQPTGLVLRCSRGDLWGSYNNALNLFLINNPAEDFTMTVRLRWPVPPSGNWEQFDLLAYDNDDNHVRIDYTANNGALAIGRVAEVNGAVSQQAGVAVDFGTAWCWLRMRKQGSTYSGWYSANGVDFLQATAPFTYGDGTPVRLGFAAMSGVNGPENAMAVIDSFEVEGSPLPAPTITSALTATGRVNRPFTYTITATDNPTGYGAEGLPASLSVNSASGVVLGLPGAAGAFTVLLSATNSGGVGTTNLFLTIADNAPVQWAGNGHWYQAVYTGPAGLAWSDASAAAANAGGYLATITSADENAFAYALVADPIFWVMDNYGNGLGPWLGGLQPFGSAEPGGGWEWVTGESMAYSNWASGEPNNSQGIDDRVHFLGLHTLQGSWWNDIAAWVPVRGYLVEYPQLPSPPSLAITLSNAVAVIRWPAPAEGWLLERANILTGITGPWTQVPPPYQTNNGVISVRFTNAPPAGNQFFRLRRP